MGSDDRQSKGEHPAPKEGGSKKSKSGESKNKKGRPKDSQARRKDKEEAKKAKEESKKGLGMPADVDWEPEAEDPQYDDP